MTITHKQNKRRMVNLGLLLETACISSCLERFPASKHCSRSEKELVQFLILQGMHHEQLCNPSPSHPKFGPSEIVSVKNQESAAGSANWQKLNLPLFISRKICLDPTLNVTQFSGRTITFIVYHSEPWGIKKLGSSFQFFGEMISGRY